MKKLILCITFSLMSINTCIADDPNNPLTVDYNSCEAQIKKLKDRIIELENRIAELESQRPALPTRSLDTTSSTRNDPDKDSLRIERCTKAVKMSQSLIALYEVQLKNLPTCYHLPIPDVNESKNLPHYYYYYYYYGRIHYHFMSLDDELNWALDNIELLDDIEKEYKVIKNYAQRNPELNIDRIDISKKLIVLRSEWVGFDKVRDDLRNSMEKGHRFMRSRCYESISKRTVRADGVND
jgi:cell division protein FtsB